MIGDSIDINNEKLLCAIGLCMFIFGFIGFLMTFTEVQVLNSVYQIGNKTISFQGFPWDTKEIGGVCLIRGNLVSPSCAFPNYKYLLEFCLISSMAGLVMWRYF